MFRILLASSNKSHLTQINKKINMTLNTIIKIAKILIEIIRKIEIKNVEEITIPKEAFVIFHTGRIDKREYGTFEYFNYHPQLSHNLIEDLIKKEQDYLVKLL